MRVFAKLSISELKIGAGLIQAALLWPEAIYLNDFDKIAHVISLSTAPVFLLSGVGTILSVLSGRLARIIDRARILEARLDATETVQAAAIVRELHTLERRGQLIYRAITLSTVSALMVCFVIASLFASSVLHHSTRIFVTSLFIVAMLSSIVSLILFLREVFLAIGTFEIGLPARKRAAAA